MEKTITLPDGIKMRVGDMVTIPRSIWPRPRWWQFWKRWPFVRPIAETYRVKSIHYSTMTVDGPQT